jgi:hypothetical protein
MFGRIYDEVPVQPQKASLSPCGPALEWSDMGNQSPSLSSGQALIILLYSQSPPSSLRRDVDLRDGIFVCGDHRDTATFDGAMLSGRRAVEALLKNH